MAGAMPVAMEILPLPNVLTYALDPDRAERAEPEAVAMQLFSGLRNRGLESRSSRLPEESGERRQGATGITPSKHLDEKPRLEPNDVEDVSNVGQQGGLLALFRKLFHRRTVQEKEAEIAQNLSLKDRYKLFKYHTVGEHGDDVVFGIRQLAAFVNSDDTFAIFRKFGQLSARVLVKMQIDITDLENKLDKLDASDAADPIMRLRLQGLQDFDGWDEEQQKLTLEIKNRLEEYFDFFLKFSQMRRLGTAPARHHKALFDWMWDWQPIYTGKDDFIRYPDDFVSACRDENDSRLGDFIKDSMENGPAWLKRLIQTERELRHVREDQYVDMYDKGRLAMWVRIIAVCLVVGILLLPVMLLYLVPMSNQGKAWTTFGFIFVFAIAMCVAVDAKVVEILIGTAAYGGVLVTLLGNLNGGSGGT